MNCWKITASSKNLDATVNLPGSKSLSNRALIIQKIITKSSAEPISIQNLSDADDTIIMQEALDKTEGIIDIKNAGTCLRFLTAYFAATPGSNLTLTGSKRMKERPIAGLVHALLLLGANIAYLDKQGHIPIQIKGTELSGGEIIIDAHETSQFVSALMMIAPLMKTPIHISFKGTISSITYIEMTASLMQEFGLDVSTQHKPNYQITITNTFSSQSPLSYEVEPDWSSAAFIYQAVALAETAHIFMPKLSLKTKQGDCKIAEFMLNLGVHTTQQADGIFIEKSKIPMNNMPKEFNLINNPDLAPAMISAAAALGLKYKFSGLSSLKVKESNRLLNLFTELSKLGFNITALENNCLKTAEPKAEIKNIEPIVIETENDHRMVMCFALLALKREYIFLSEMGSVEKSFPNFWEEMRKLGIEVENIVNP